MIYGIHPTTYVELSSFCVGVSQSGGRSQQSVAEVLRVHVEVASEDHDVRSSGGVAEEQRIKPLIPGGVITRYDMSLLRPKKRHLIR